MPNRLASEQSPYLLQHAENPVDWYAWGEEAFARARADDLPIFLSIGYSTCHWCHVMEHESFEDARIADLLNRHFVPIKVDREERPDVDRVYMAFVQATTGAGGWPMSVWLTPALEPFYGGTYYPPASQYGRPGFGDVLREIARAWREERPAVIASARQIVQRLAAVTSPVSAGELPGPEALASTVRAFQQTFDARYGGFGDQPKFPRPSELLFLLREHARTGDEAARDMVLITLRAMALGGLRDHIGGGFHRYSVDRQWRVPHFEKMLYDQAQLVVACLEAFQVSADPFLAEVAEDTLRYVDRELTDEGGGFHSAEDADSVPLEEAGVPDSRKTEGAFYLWSVDELRAVAGPDSRVFELRYGLLPDGNAPFDPHNEFGRKNLLYTARSIGEIANETGLEAEEVDAALSRARQALFAARRARPRPHLDDKVLTAWNGLMLGAFARAARVLAGGARDREGEAHGARYLQRAERAALFLTEVMWDEAQGRLKRRYRQRRAAIDGYAEDYACLVSGLLELFQASGEARWLEWAIRLQERMDALFWDGAGGGWFSTTGEDPSVLLRMKDDYDGAEPSATSMGVVNVLTLGELTGEARYRERADRALGSGSRLPEHGRAVPLLAAARSFGLARRAQIAVVGHRDRVDTQGLWNAVHAGYHPFAVVVPVEPGDSQKRLAPRMPWVAAMTMREGKATAYVCHDLTCEAPVTDARALRAQLDG